MTDTRRGNEREQGSCGHDNEAIKKGNSINTNMGIGDMALYVPSPRILLDDILKQRIVGNPDMERRLKRAIENTGQISFCFPEPWDDSVTLAANAASELLNRNPQDCEKLRYITVGSETAVDHSKPIASYVQGMLQQSGLPIGNDLTTFEIKHACAGGTAAILTTAALLGFSGNPEDKGLAVCTDISRYDAPSTAEITQGSGSVAMVIERNPRLLELDMDQHGYYAADKDDFFRPLGSVTAKVKGRYSMECYQVALVAAFENYCERRGGTPCQLADEVDYVALHVPFVRMPQSALVKLLSETCGKNSEQVEAYMERTRFMHFMDFNREAGNLYTGSLYAYLISLLSSEYDRIGTEIIGKSILIASYGSGNTMIVFTAVVAPGAAEVISKWKTAPLRERTRLASFREYEAWLARPKDLSEWAAQLAEPNPEPGLFYLKGFGETGLRLYGRS